MVSSMNSSNINSSSQDCSEVSQLITEFGASFNANRFESARRNQLTPPCGMQGTFCPTNNVYPSRAPNTQCPQQGETYNESSSWPPIAGVNYMYPDNAYDPYYYQLPCYNPGFCVLCQRPYTCQPVCSLPQYVPPVYNNHQLAWQYPYPYYNVAEVQNLNDVTTQPNCENSNECNKTQAQAQQPGENAVTEDKSDCEEIDICRELDICRAMNVCDDGNAKRERDKKKTNSNDNGGKKSSDDSDRSSIMAARGGLHATRLTYRDRKRVPRPTGLGTCGSKHCARSFDISPKRKYSKDKCD